MSPTKDIDSKRSRALEPIDTTTMHPKFTPIAPEQQSDLGAIRGYLGINSTRQRGYRYELTPDKYQPWVGREGDLQ